MIEDLTTVFGTLGKSTETVVSPFSDFFLRKSPWIGWGKALKHQLAFSLWEVWELLFLKITLVWNAWQTIDVFMKFSGKNNSHFKHFSKNIFSLQESILYSVLSIYSIQ